MPIFIPESLLQKEADHVEGFAPECSCNARRHDKLEERLCVRPTSETLFWRALRKKIVCPGAIR